MIKGMNVDLNKLGDGALAEQVAAALKQISKNILDPNTEAKKARKLTINLGFTPGENRDTVALTMSVKTSLQPRKPAITTMLVGQDATDGHIEMNELQSGVKGQTYFDDDGKVRTDTGVPVEDVEKKNSEPIDFQAAKHTKEAN